MWGELLKPVVDYLSKQQFQNVMMAVLVGVIVYFNIERNKQTKESHDMAHQVFKEIRAESQENQDRLVEVMTGIKREVKRNTEATKEIPVAAAKAAQKIVEGKAAEKEE